MCRICAGVILPGESIEWTRGFAGSLRCNFPSIERDDVFKWRDGLPEQARALRGCAVLRVLLVSVKFLAVDKLRAVRLSPYRRGAGPRFHLVTWDTRGRDGRGQTKIGYRLTEHRGGASRVLFEGADFCGSPVTRRR